MTCERFVSTSYYGNFQTEIAIYPKWETNILESLEWSDSPNRCVF
jgi:hypothetical protein